MRCKLTTMGRNANSRRGPVLIWNGVLRAKTKVCLRCKSDKPIPDFSLKKYTTGGGNKSVSIHSWCRACDNAHRMNKYRADPERFRANRKRWEAKNPEHVRSISRRKALRCFLKKLGVPLEVYFELYEAQDGNCLICKRHFDRLSVDHCHKTNKIRGLLYVRCNLAVGNIREDVTAAENLLAYAAGVCNLTSNQESANG